MTIQNLLKGIRYYQISIYVKNWFIVLNSEEEDAVTRCYKILEENPELEAQLILLIALTNHDISLLDSITERACIRWSDGYSDSLSYAVLCNMPHIKRDIKINYVPNEEVIEKSEKADENPRINWYEEVKSIFGADISLSNEVLKMLGAEQKFETTGD